MKPDDPKHVVRMFEDLSDYLGSARAILEVLELRSNQGLFPICEFGERMEVDLHAANVIRTRLMRLSSTAEQRQGIDMLRKMDAQVTADREQFGADGSCLFCKKDVKGDRTHRCWIEWPKEIP
jgi:hypothetical protein